MLQKFLIEGMPPPLFEIAASGKPALTLRKNAALLLRFIENMKLGSSLVYRYISD